jgi:hypothetical protein
VNVGDTCVYIICGEHECRITKYTMPNTRNMVCGVIGTNALILVCLQEYTLDKLVTLRDKTGHTERGTHPIGLRNNGDETLMARSDNTPALPLAATGTKTSDIGSTPQHSDKLSGVVIDNLHTEKTIQKLASVSDAFRQRLADNDTVQARRGTLLNYSVPVATTESLGGVPVIPASVLSMLTPNVKQRIHGDLIAKTCRFDAMQHEYQKRRAMGATGTVTWACTDFCGGNGDRLRGISATLVRAVSIGYDFRLQWTNPVPVSEVFTEREYVSWLSPTHPSSGKTLSVHAIDSPGDLKFCEWSRHENVNIRTNLPGKTGSDRRIQNESCHLQHRFYREPIMRSRGWDTYQLGYHAMVGCSFWYLFAIGKRLENKLLEELNRFQAWKVAHGRTENPTVGVHIRSGDKAMGVGDDVRIGTVGDEGAFRVMGCALKWSREIGLENATFLVVSDTPKSRELAVSFLPGQVWSSSAVPFHTDKSRGDRLMGTISSWVDLLLLALTEAIVLSPSGFGEAASNIGMFPRQRVLTSLECILTHDGLKIRDAPYSIGK